MFHVLRSLSLIGTSLCFFIMFSTHWDYAIVSSALCLIIYKYVEWKGWVPSQVFLYISYTPRQWSCSQYCSRDEFIRYVLWSHASIVGSGAEWGREYLLKVIGRLRRSKTWGKDIWKTPSRSFEPLRIFSGGGGGGMGRKLETALRRQDTLNFRAFRKSFIGKLQL